MLIIQQTPRETIIMSKRPQPNQEGSEPKKLKHDDLTVDQEFLAWKRRVREQDALEELEELKREAYEKGYKIGKLKEGIKAEISTIKSLIEHNIPRDKFIPKLEFLTNDKVKDNLESNLKYIQEHINDSTSDICNELGLVGSLSDFDIRDI